MDLQKDLLTRINAHLAWQEDIAGRKVKQLKVLHDVMQASTAWQVQADLNQLIT